ncbi:MAG: hypothetical protein WDN72_04335 [Alphaproteobacteria bacterium]
MATQTRSEHSGPITGIVFVVLLVLVAGFAYRWVLAPGSTPFQQAAGDVARGATDIWHDHGNTSRRFHDWLERHRSDYRLSTH